MTMANNQHMPQDEPDNAPTLKMRRAFPLPRESTPDLSPEPEALVKVTEASFSFANTSDEAKESASSIPAGEAEALPLFEETSPMAEVARDAVEHAITVPLGMSPPATLAVPDASPRWAIAEDPLLMGNFPRVEPPLTHANSFAANVSPPGPYPSAPFIDEGYQPTIDRMPEPRAQATRPIDDEEDTTVKTFEYCRVVIDSGQYSQTQGRYPYFVRVTLDYYGAHSTPSYKFNQDTDKMDGPDKSWGRMLGLLGAAGWEMINITIGKAKDLSILEAMAYFKRPVEEGREIDQPAISL
jgi:hypothetical protein